MTKEKKLEEIEVRVSILNKNIKDLEDKMVDPESRRKYRHPLGKLKEAKKKLFELAQKPGNSHPIK